MAPSLRAAAREMKILQVKEIIVIVLISAAK